MLSGRGKKYKQTGSIRAERGIFRPDQPIAQTIRQRLSFVVTSTRFVTMH